MTRLAFPYGFDAEGRSATVDYGGDEHLRDLLELLILTLVGERVMRPDLGSPALQMVFGHGEGATALALKATLEAAISQWLGHVLKLRSLTARYIENEGSLQIVVEYGSRRTGIMSEAVINAGAA